ncbi:MAG TPA: hypothetical protein VFV72_02255 [Candidatus Limnocylindrales bacterium]|nr:hypothetical protein [Candidatus Limnocylindrales bacterium]
MNARTNPDDILAAWLDENTVPMPAPTRRAIEVGIRTIHQRRRPIWLPRRIEPMSTPLAQPAVRGLAAMVTVVVVVAVGAFALFGQRTGVGPPPPPSPTASSAPESPSAVPTLPPYPTGAAGTFRQQPFAARNLGLNSMCLVPPPSGCVESTADDSISVTFTVPDGWTGGIGAIWRVEGNGPPSGAAVMFARGGWLFEQPCAGGTPYATIPTGTTVDEFVTALVDHPDLDVTEPVDVTLAGYNGKYLELRAPANIADNQDAPGPDECAYYFVWEPNIYAQGPNQLWRLWVLDVAGTRVVVRADSFPEESPATTLTEQQDILDSIQIEP